jgi:hypothetical protein
VRPHRARGHAFSLSVALPPGATTYDWTLMDHVVEEAQKAGVDLVPTLQPFADPRPPSGSPAVVPSVIPEEASLWIGFVEDVVERYDGDGHGDMPGLTRAVKKWEVGNEPDCPEEDTDCHQGFVDLVATAWTAAHTSDPSTTIIAGASAPIFNPTGATNDRAEAVYEYFLAHGGLAYTDALNIHYTTGTTSPDVSVYLAWWYARTGPIDLWVTETATRNVGDTSRVAWDEQAEADWLTDHFDATFDGGATHVFWCLTSGDITRYPKVTEAVKDYAATL